MDDAESLLDRYLATTFNSSLKLIKLSREQLIGIARRAQDLSGDFHVQFERLLMEGELS